MPISKNITAADRPQLQCLLFRLEKYDVELTYLKGKDNVTTNTLIGVSPLVPEPEDKDIFVVIPVHHITAEIPVTGSQCESVRVTTQSDSILR